MRIQWYPGHMTKAKRMMESQVKLVDVVVEMLDARIPRSSTNPMLMQVIGSKPKVIALNKTDMADPVQTEAWMNKLKNSGYPVCKVDCSSGKGVKQMVALVQQAAKPVIDKWVKKGLRQRSVRVMIVGIPNVGKSTLFNCLSSAKAQAANFPFCTIEPNVGVITVPDERLTKLAEIVHPGRIVPATCEIVDIAGLVKGASKGEGLGNKFLGNIRETDAIIHVLRCFDDPNVVHVDGSIDPIRDKEVIDAELQLKDLETVESRIQKIEKQVRVGGDKQAKAALEIYLRYKAALEQGQSARVVTPENKEEEAAAHELFLLTAKPVLYVCNVDESAAVSGNEYVERVRKVAEAEGAEVLVVAAKIESEIAELETADERQMFLEELGLEESGVNRLIHAAYDLLGLQTYITAGPMEVKAWTYRKGMKAPQCAGIIHGDFEKGFIRAQVIKYEDYIKYGSEAAVKEAGKMGIEGKEYVVQDGDIMHFLFNV